MPLRAKNRTTLAARAEDNSQLLGNLLVKIGVLWQERVLLTPEGRHRGIIGKPFNMDTIVKRGQYGCHSGEQCSGPF